MHSTAWPSPAKLNLFLHITGRRPDGYHKLQTVFQFIDLCDEIDFTIKDADSVDRISDMLGVEPDNDLAIRAAKKLKQFSGCNKGVDINVTKRIPHGGGLGGGSSDAATSLVALNQLWQLGLSVDELAMLGLELGADVPVFVRGHAAWAEGVGENLSPIEPDESVYLVIHPGISIATADVFNATDLTRNTPAITIRDFLERGGVNDCESVVRNHYAEVASALDWLGQFAPAKLTGTGACLFAIFPTAKDAEEVKNNIPGNWQGFVVNGMNQSPLIGRLAKEQAK